MQPFQVRIRPAKGPIMTIRVKQGLSTLLAAMLLIGCQREAAGKTIVEPRAAWARATAPGQESGGVFLTLENRGAAADRVTAGTTPVAESVEFHTMTMHDTIMRMQQRKAVDLPAGGTIKLEPGGTHIMLVGLKAPLRVGETFPLTLDFAGAGRKQVQVEVLPIGAMGPRDGSDE